MNAKRPAIVYVIAILVAVIAGAWASRTPPTTTANVGVTSPKAVVLWFHGGGWSHGSPDSCNAGWMREHGYKIRRVTYRLAPAHTWPAQLVDAIAAVDAARKEFPGIPVVALGYSAGGHLAACLAALGHADAAIVNGAPLDMTMPHKEPLRAAVEAVLGGCQYRDASPVHMVTGEATPVLVIHGTVDMTVPQEHAIVFKAAMDAAGVECDVLYLPGVGHMGAEFLEPSVKEQILRFLDEMLSNSRAILAE